MSIWSLTYVLRADSDQAFLARGNADPDHLVL